ncbi:MAG: hypothetical protein JXA49_02925, partial [Actinobacteria bacterium]|nr:hypothetical protein [Actinomycetota bacterium]
MFASVAPETAAHAVNAVNSILPAVALFLPLLGGFAVIIAAKFGEKVRNGVAIFFAAETFIACAAMFPEVMSRGGVLQTRLPLFSGDLYLAVDQIGLIFALFASFVWLAATLYSWNYIQHEEKRTRYHAFSLFTEAAALGIFMASDFFVLFIFFELMGILAYMLVVHTETGESLKAGTKYMALTILGGLSLLMGIFLLIYYGGGFSFTPQADSSYLTSGICFVVAGFLIGGFGVKAGMVPLHIWLPLAHPAAPSPASALLSGVMIKAGAFGFIRLIGTFLSQAPTEAAVMVASHGEEPAHAVSPWIGNLHDLGIAIIILALATMVIGMVLAIFQDNMKRLLAYSSISQMGFILMGVGTAAYLGAEGVLGLEGALEHIINHAFFKSLLFLCAGAIYYRTHTLNMRGLGGLWRKMPWTTAFAVIGGMGIMGISFFNGFVSKTILHHSIAECCEVGG